MKRPQFRRHDGFSLIELLVTIVLATIVFSAMVPVFISGQQVNSKDTVRTACANVAQDRIEKVRQIDYDEITQANLDDPTFKADPDTGEPFFGTTYSYVGGTTTRTLLIDYDVILMPTGSLPGTEQYKVVKVDVTWTGNPQPAYHTVMQTIVYKQYAGPTIEAFHVIQYGSPLITYIKPGVPATLEARITEADVPSMDAGNVEEDQRGWVAFSVMNSQGTIIDQAMINTPDADEPGVYRWDWTPNGGDGLFTFTATAYSGARFQGSSWQLTYRVDGGAPGVPVLAAESGNNLVTLSWYIEPIPTDLDYYEVWRATASTGPWVSLGRTDSQTMLDTGVGLTPPTLVNGDRYYYRVAAMDSGGGLSEYGTASCVPLAPSDGDTIGPEAPAGVTAAKAAANAPSITVAWAAEPADLAPFGVTPSGFDQYIIERCAHPGFANGVTQWFYPRNNLSYTDTTAGYLSTWYYRVAGLDMRGNLGPWSDVVSATTDDTLYFDLTVANGNTGTYNIWILNIAQGRYYKYVSTTASSSSTSIVNAFASTLGRNKTATVYHLPAGIYKVFWGSPLGSQKGSIDADLSVGGRTVNIP